MRKVLFRAFVITALILSLTLTSLSITSPTGLPYVSVDPQTNTTGVGMSFDIDITVTGITLPNDLYGWEANLTFNPEILNCTGAEEGPFLKDVPPGFTKWGVTIQNEYGWVYMWAGFSPPPPSGAIGSGTLATVTFKALAVGSTPLNFLFPTDLTTVDEHGVSQSIPQDPPVSGFFTNVHDVAVADVKPSTTSVMLGDPVSIDVTVDNEGYFTETFDVTTYWNIGALRGEIGTKTVTNLEGGTSTTPPSFTWDTTGICTGTYTISAEASLEGETDPADNTFINGEVTVFHPEAPIADFTLSPEKPKVNDMVTFNASASFDPNGQIVSWDWDFNDGNVESGKVVTHAYTEAGTYNVTLTVKDNDELCNIVWKPLKVLSYPVARFTYFPEEPLRNRTVTFDASGSTPDGGTIISYAWDFDDGTTRIYVGENLTDTTTHTYTTAGTYRVNLTITDSEGLTSFITHDVTVSIKHDVAVLSVFIPREYKPVYAGKLIKIAVVVRNEGTETETFNVTVYLDDTPIETREVTDLAPLDETTPSPPIYWNTMGLSAGKYTITAEAILDGDENSTNNKATTPMDVSVADLAITNVTVSSTTVLAGDLLNVSVTVKNEGTANSTELAVYIYLTNSTSSDIRIIDFGIDSLESGTERTQSGSCNATKYRWTEIDPLTNQPVEKRISPGTYTLSAYVEPIKLESDLEDNTYTYGSVTVGASLISIYANPETVTLGSTTTINGSITPARPNVSVTLQYRLSGSETWNSLETVTTDENSAYACDWKPETTGTYEVMASWEGDNDALPSESEILTLIVNPAQPNVFLYVVAAVAIIVMAATAIYLLRFRKSKPT